MDAMCTNPATRLAAGPMSGCDEADAAVAGAGPFVLSLVASLRGMWICEKSAHMDCVGVVETLVDISIPLIALSVVAVVTFVIISRDKRATERSLAITSPLPSEANPSGWNLYYPPYVKPPTD